MRQSAQKIIRNKIGLLNLTEELGNVSKAYLMMGVSRNTFNRYQSARDEGGVEALLERTLSKYQSSTATWYTKPRAIGMRVMSPAVS